MKFAFRLHLMGPTSDVDVARLFACGFDDALFHTIEGRPLLDMEREADSREKAVSEAVLRVREAGQLVVTVERLPLLDDAWALDD